MKYIRSTLFYICMLIGLIILLPGKNISCASTGKWYYDFQPQQSDVGGITLPAGSYYYFETEDHRGSGYVYHTLGFTISRASAKDTYEGEECISLCFEDAAPNTSQGKGNEYFIIVEEGADGYMKIKWGINADWIERTIQEEHEDWYNDINTKLENYEDAWVIIDGVVETASKNKDTGEYIKHWGEFTGGTGNGNLHSNGCVYVSDHLLTQFQIENPAVPATGEEAEHFKETGAHSPSEFFENDFVHPGKDWPKDRYRNSILLRRIRKLEPDPDEDPEPTEYMYEWTTWEDKEDQDGKLRSEKTPYYVTYNDSRNYMAVSDGDADKNGTTYHSAFTENGSEIIIPAGEKYINGVSLDSYWGKIGVGLGNGKKTWNFKYKFMFTVQWYSPNPDYDSQLPEGNGNVKYIAGNTEVINANSETAGFDMSVDVTRYAFYYYMNYINMYDFSRASITNDAIESDTKTYRSDKLHANNVTPKQDIKGPVHQGDKIYDDDAKLIEDRPTYYAKIMLDGHNEPTIIDDTRRLHEGANPTTRYEKVNSFEPSDELHIKWADVDTSEIDLKEFLSNIPGANPLDVYDLTKKKSDLIAMAYSAYASSTGHSIADYVKLLASNTRVGNGDDKKTRTKDGTYEDTFAWVKNDTLTFGYEAKECLKENKKPGTKGYDSRGIPVTSTKVDWSKDNRPPYLETSDVKPEWIDNTDIEIYESSPAFGSSQVCIEPEQKNGKYPTSIINLFSSATNEEGQAEKEGVVYNRVLASTSSDPDRSWNKLSTVDSSERILDGFGVKDPIIVQTPVISPVSFHDDDDHDGSGKDSSKGKEEAMPTDSDSTQLDPGEAETGVTQMRLDETYWFRFDLRSHLQRKGYRSADTSGDDANGWKDMGNTKDKYDKYVKAKYVHFPFDVMLYNDGGTSDPIYIKHTDNESDPNYWTEVKDWEWTKFYIPTWAREGVYKDADSVRYKVEAKNVISSTSTDQNASEFQQGTQDNTDEDQHGEYELNDRGNGDMEPNEELYIAKYRLPVQISGWIYDFQIEGVNNADIYNTDTDADDTVGWNDMWVPLCLTKNSTNAVGSEKKTGYYNRLGGVGKYQADLAKYVRYTNSGKATNSWLFENTLAIANGSSSNYSKMGILPKGSRVNFSVKTLSNLWNEGDKVSIKPTFYYVTKDGTVKKDVTVYYNDYSKDTGKLTYVKYGSTEDTSLVRQVTLSDEGFSGSYKDEDVTLSAKLPKPKYTGSHPDVTEIENYNKTITSEDITKFLTKKTDSYNLSQIVLPSTLRVFSGNVEELKANLKEDRDSVNMKALDHLYKMSAEEANYITPLFRVSMQTWYGEYYVPSELFVTEKDDSTVRAKADSYEGLSETDPDIWLHGGHIVVHFDIVTVPQAGGGANGIRALRYQGTTAKNNQWKNQGQPLKPIPTEANPDPDPMAVTAPLTEYGDVLVIDDSETTDHKYGAKIFVID